jgi:hypothetical protein
MFTEELTWLGESDKPLVMGEALSGWWGGDARRLLRADDHRARLLVAGEPLRVCRRLHSLRRWSYGKEDIKPIFS